MQYVSTADADDAECIFCRAGELPPDEVHVVHARERGFVLLNAFPYNTGHVMIAPRRHVGELAALDSDERNDVMELVTVTVDVVGSEMSAHGFNVGMNLGRVAGAGIPGHLHIHVVPRWGGDTNFMPVVAQTKVLPEMLDETFARLKKAFGSIRSG